MLNKKSKIKSQKTMDSCPPERQLNAVKSTLLLKLFNEGVHLASKIFLVLIIFLASGLFQRGQMTIAYADSISLGIDPPILQINATPPASIVSPLTVENRGNSPLNISIQFEPFTASDKENGQIKYINKKDANLADPLFFERLLVIDETGKAITQFKIDPKEKKKLSLSINIPKDSPQSDYYFSIIFLSGAGSSNTSSSQNVSGIASNVLLSVGQGKISGEIEEFSAPVFIEKGPVPFTVRVKNSSNNFITPKGEILVKNIFGQTIGKIDLEQVNILSQSVRSIPSTEFLNGEENLPQNLNAYWPEKFILGPYKATLSLTLSDTGPLFRRSIIFFAFPAKTSAVIILGIIFLIYIILKVKSKA